MGDSEVLMSDKVVQELMGEQGDLIQTGSPAILCTPLPTHWRSNKSLPVAFKVFTFQVSNYWILVGSGRALRVLVFFESSTRKTGRCAPPAHRKVASSPKNIYLREFVLRSPVGLFLHHPKNTGNRTRCALVKRIFYHGSTEPNRYRFPEVKHPMKIVVEG